MIAHRGPLVIVGKSRVFTGVRLVCLSAVVLGTLATGTLRAADTPPNYRDLGPLTGTWEGKYVYPAGSGMDPVIFTLVLIQEGDRVTGMIREPNTFGEKGNPWLHATLDGRFSAESRVLRFTKTYDGTAGVNHDVEYKGQVSADTNAVEYGTWTIPGDGSGTFTMRRKAGSVR
jgi:hypothetical protein